MVSKISTSAYLLNIFFQHGVGEIWAQILWIVANTLIKKHGFADSLFPSAVPGFYRTRVSDSGALTLVPKHGNTLMLQ